MGFVDLPGLITFYVEVMVFLFFAGHAFYTVGMSVDISVRIKEEVVELEFEEQVRLELVVADRLPIKAFFERSKDAQRAPLHCVLCPVTFGVLFD